MWVHNSFAGYQRGVHYRMSDIESRGIKKSKAKCFCRGWSPSSDSGRKNKEGKGLARAVTVPYEPYNLLSCVCFVKRQPGVDVREIDREAGAGPIIRGLIYHQWELGLYAFLQKLFIGLTMGQAFF